MYNYNIKRRKFLGLIGCCTCGLIIPSCATAPITQRRQLKILPESYINRQAFRMYQKVKNSKNIKISNDKKTLSEIREIGRNIEESVSAYFDSIDKPDPTFNFQWEYILIDNEKIKNAWCMPGGKIAVYTGILDITKNKHGLASVMGHEIAHAVAKHSVERASRGIVVNLATQITDILSGGKLSQVNRATVMNTIGLLSQIGILNPFNRKQETEADYLGLIFSSLSGYDIRETVKIWERMKAANKGKEQSEFMSTHPSSTNRIKNINGWTNQIIMDYPPILAS